jgi:small subunit ribosomal protein S16
MLTIRLTRKGKKNQPFFRVVVIDKRRSSKGGRAVEVLGYVNPLTKKHSLEKDRVLHWLKMGAQPTPRIHNLLVNDKIIAEKKVNVFNKTKRALKAEADKAAAAAAPAVVATPAQTPVAEAPKEEPKAENQTPETPAQA